MSAQSAKTWPDKMEQTTETNSTTYNYYVLRNNDGEFKIIYMSVADAMLWKAAGWEFSCHNSNEEAGGALVEWKKSPYAGATRTGIHFA